MEWERRPAGDRFARPCRLWQQAGEGDAQWPGRRGGEGLESRRTRAHRRPSDRAPRPRITRAIGLPDCDHQRKSRVFTLVESMRSEEHTSELQSLMRISYAVFCLKKKRKRYQK